MREKGYPLYPYHKYKTFRECLEGMNALHPGQVSLTCYSPHGDKREMTTAQLYEQVSALSAAMLSRGYEGKRVAFVAPGDEKYIVTLFAVCTLGGVAITVDTEQSDDTIRSMVHCADAEAVTCSREFMRLFTNEYSNCLCLDGQSADAFCYEDVVREGRAIVAAGGRTFRDVTTTPEQPAMLVYTSGTTSTAKPVSLSQSNVITNACRANAMVNLGERTFTSLPLYHTYGLTCGVIGHISHGKNVCINSSLKTTMRDVKLFSPDSMTVVPLIAEAVHGIIMTELRKQNMLPAFRRFMLAFRALEGVGIRIKSPFARQVRKALGGRLSMMVCGGAHMQANIARELEALGIQVMQGYGITECSPLVSVNRNCREKRASAGLLLPDTRIAFDEGEILVAGESVMLGYYGDEDATRSVMRDGYFRTGDLGRLDRDGFLYILGRKKNLIVFKSGKKVAPEEIEGYVKDLPLVSEVVAYGARAGDSPDDVKLALTVYPDPAKSAGIPPVEILRIVQDKVNAVNRTLPAYKQIQIVTLRDRPFEKNTMRKIVRTSVHP